MPHARSASPGGFVPRSRSGVRSHIPCEETIHWRPLGHDFHKARPAEAAEYSAKEAQSEDQHVFLHCQRTAQGGANYLRVVASEILDTAGLLQTVENALAEQSVPFDPFAVRLVLDFVNIGCAHSLLFIVEQLGQRLL